MYCFLLFLLVLALVTNNLASSIPTRTPAYCVTVFLLFLVLVTNTLASPVPTPPVNETITQAAHNWLQDTKTVSSFLDYAVTFPASSPPDILKNAAEALTAELDELTYKAVLDKYFLNKTSKFNQEVYFANAVLATGGIFQFVVDSLKNISETGNVSIVNNINVARCMWILPAIDVYFEQVALATNQTVIELAWRPKACPVGSNLPRRR